MAARRIDGVRSAALNAVIVNILPTGESANFADSLYGKTLTIRCLTAALVVPKIAGFSEQTYKFGAFVPGFGHFSEQTFIRFRATVLFSARSAE